MHSKIFTLIEGTTGILLIQGVTFAELIELEKLILQTVIGLLTIAALLIRLKKKKK